jgi:hypothetical protein
LNLLRPASYTPALLLVFLTLLYSCATPPVTHILPPESIVGLYAGRDGGKGYGLVMEMRFFPGGTAHIHSVWEDDGASYSEVGQYNYSPESGALSISFEPEVSWSEVSTSVSGATPSFTADGIHLEFRADPVLPARRLKPEDLSAAWIMNYQYDGTLVEVTLNIDGTGLFTETTRYPGGDDDLIESGRYELDGNTGLITFYYNLRPDFGYTGYYDSVKELLYTFDGDFYREEY